MNGKATVSGLALRVIIVLLLMAVYPACGATETNNTYRALYEQWHQCLSKDTFVTEPMYFSTNCFLGELAGANQEIQRNKIGMAMFVCELMANTKYDAPANPAHSLYRDVHLIREVAGIDLIFAEDKPSIDQDIGANIIRFTARFQREWNEGVYRDPSRKVALFCEVRLPKEKGDAIRPLDLVAIRRYGIFGLPELIRQIKSHNSKHAFAAYLIITGHAIEYSQYILDSNRLFVTKDDKLKHIRSEVQEMTSGPDADRDVVKKSSAALSE